MTIIAILALLVFVFFGLAAVSAAPWVPLRKKDTKALVRDLNIGPKKVFVELGSGDGRLLKAASMTGAKVVGYELNPLLWFISFMRLIKTPNAKVYLRNFWRCSLKEADTVGTFLIPRTMPKLEKKLEKEMKPGSRFVSYVFQLPTKKPAQKHRSWYIYNY